jgi:hypothetical protein
MDVQKTRRQPDSWECPWLVIYCSAAIFFAGCDSCEHLLSDTRLDDTQKRAERIITALESYKEDNSVYPATLEALVPRYLDRIEPPLIGDRWEYSAPSAGSEFILGFQGDENEPCGWLGPGGKSWVDTK